MRFAAQMLAMTVLGAAIGTEAVAEEEKITLRLTIQAGLSSPMGVEVSDFKRIAEDLSKGSISVEIFDKARLYLDHQVPEAVGSGAIEMGVAGLGQFAKDIPVAGVFHQPFLFDRPELVRAAVARNSDIRRIIEDAILHKAGARALLWHSYGSAVMISRGDPIPNPDAMTGRNIRALDSAAAEFVTLCGGVPNIVSGSKMLKALEARQVDAVMTGVLGVKGRELWRETDAVTKIRHSELMFALFINETVWQSLSRERQEILLEAARRADENYHRDFADLEASGYAFAKDKGMAIVEIGSDDLLAWRICSSPQLEGFMSRGGVLAAKVMAAYGRLKAEQSLHAAHIRPR